jgi:hypothetical protein
MESTAPTTAGADAGAAEGIREFTIEVPEEQLEDLRSRINAAKWPDPELDASQGVQATGGVATTSPLRSAFGVRRLRLPMRSDHRTPHEHGR